MASSDEEGEILPQCVTNYCLVGSDKSPVPLSSLPLQSSDNVGSESNKSVFLHGTVDSGIDKIFKEVLAWKFELSYVHPEILVRSKSKNWIKLQKPNKSYEDFIRSILVTVHLLNLIKKDPDAPVTSIWRHLQKLFSTLEEGPSEKDILQHIDLISTALSVDRDLIRSKYLLNILKRSYGKEVTSLENVVPTPRTENFVVDDEVGDAEQNNDSEDDMDELFDSVCTICDDGGKLLCCDGRCMRSFHATKEDGQASGCESLGFSNEKVNAISSFLCQNCIDRRHQCFACGRLGSSDVGSGAQVFPCISATCGRFYHPDCIAKLIHPEDATKAADLQHQIVHGESFTCSVHICAVCKKLEDRTSHELELQFAVCKRCPTSYHRKCMPKSISFEGTSDFPTRAWIGLLEKRVLIYCLKHRINQEFGTPSRDHILFSDTWRSGMGQASKQFGQMKILKGPNMFLPKNIGSNIPKHVDRSNTETKRPSSLASFSPGKRLKSRVEKHSSNYAGTLLKPFWSGTDASRRLSASSTLVDELLRGSNATQITQGTDRDQRRVKNTEKMCQSSCRSNKDSVEERIAALMKKSDALFDESKFRSNLSVVSTYSSNPWNMSDITIPQGRVDASVKAVREALKKLEEGGTLEEAKAICQPQILNQIMTWKRKLTVYLAPFLHGKRYTSYGRHFTKSEKLQEIVNRLHNYVLDGDTIVDFCCGSNEFSCLMKKKLDETGRRCSFKNYDIIKPKKDFCFENRDWMTVSPTELPDGDKLIMGLNPPFGLKASLANKFINKALEFKPKLLILIVPEETKRLDSKGAYDLIWEDRMILSGMAFYLPGSLDVHDKQIEQWNNSPPPLYLWSLSYWSSTHRGIAKQHGHDFKEQKEANQGGDTPDNDYSSDMELDEGIIEKREFGESTEETVLNVGESSIPVKNGVNQCASGASNSILDLPMSLLNSRSISTIMKPEMIKTTQGFISFTQTVPAGRCLGEKAEVNQRELGSSAQFSNAGAAAGVVNIRSSISHTSACPNWQTNLAAQPNPYIPALVPMQQHYWYGTSPYGNSLPYQGYNYYQAYFPQDAHAQYMPSYTVDPYASRGPSFQRVEADDDLPAIPGLGTYPSSYPGGP